MTYEHDSEISTLALPSPTLHQRTPVLGLADNVRVVRIELKAFAPVLERPYQSTAQIEEADLRCLKKEQIIKAVGF
jgi:hypothetical protein